MNAISLEDLLFAARRTGKRLPPAACAQLFVAVVRAAESQGVAPEPAIFLIDDQDGLVVDVQAVEIGADPLQAAAQLGRSLLIGPSGELQGQVEEVVRRGLDGGFAQLSSFRKALEAVVPPLPAEERRKLFTGLHELGVAWQGGTDGGVLPGVLELIAAGGAPTAPARPQQSSAKAQPIALGGPAGASRQKVIVPAPPPAAASQKVIVPAPPPAAAPQKITAPAAAPQKITPPPPPPPAPQKIAPPPVVAEQPVALPPRTAAAPVAASPSVVPQRIAPSRPSLPLSESLAADDPLVDRLTAIEGALGRIGQAPLPPPPRRGWRTAGFSAFSAVAGAVAAMAYIRFTTPPPKPPPPERPAPVCPPLLIVHEPAPPAPQAAPAAQAPDGGVQLAQATPPATPVPAPAATPEPAAAQVSHSSSRARSSRRSSKVASASSGVQSEADKGDRALRKGQLDEALAAFQAALAKDDRFAPAVRGLAMVHMTQGNEADAKREYERYLKLAPDAPDASRIRKVVANLGGQ